jgi:hypothetical protein
MQLARETKMKSQKIELEKQMKINQALKNQQVSTAE